MAENKQYDIAVIGGGPGGYVAAIRAAQLGAQVALIEKERLGGMCLNWGCIPTKALVHQSELYSEVCRAGEFGIDVSGPVQVNFPRMMARKNEVVETLVSGVETLVRAHKVDVYPGTGTILQPGRVRVSPSVYHPDTRPQEVEARSLIIATGSLPKPVPIPGHDLPGVVDARGLLDCTEQPKTLVVIGASASGTEFASIFAALGTRVILLERDVFLRGAEEQLAKRFRSLLARQGVRIEVGLETRQIVQTGVGSLRVEYERGGRPAAVEGDLVLNATGHMPFTGELGLEAIGLATERGAVTVDQYMQTRVPGIYAIGDVTAVYMLAHVASHQAIVAVHNALGRREAMDYRSVPNCIYTSPEIAGVGMTERQAKEEGVDYVTSRFPFNVNGRALGMGAAEGQVRMICAREANGRGGRVLGVHIMGPRASDLIAEAALAIRMGATAEDITHTIHAHPTLPEALMEAAMDMGEGAIHYKRIGGREA